MIKQTYYPHTTDPPYDGYIYWALNCVHVFREMNLRFDSSGDIIHLDLFICSEYLCLG
jgi:hypothetical protein